MYLRDVAKGIVEILNKKFEDKLGLEGEWCNMCDVVLAAALLSYACTHAVNIPLLGLSLSEMGYTCCMLY